MNFEVANVLFWILAAVMVVGYCMWAFSDGPACGKCQGWSVGCCDEPVGAPSKSLPGKPTTSLARRRVRDLADAAVEFRVEEERRRHLKP